MQAAARLRERYGVTHIRLATDSPSVVQEAAQVASDGNFSFTFLQINRTEFGGPEGINRHLSFEAAQTNFIERRVAAASAGLCAAQATGLIT